LQTRRNAELDSENVINGEGPKAENAASETLRAGDRISETISSGKLLAMMGVWKRGALCAGVYALLDPNPLRL
jgi:hypothetical protein